MEIRSKNQIYLQALKTIAAWQLPETNEFWDREKKQPMSYEAAHGSNGARDYIKNIARTAIEEGEKLSPNKEQTIESYKKAIEEATGKECIIILVDQIDTLLTLLSLEEILEVVERRLRKNSKGIKARVRQPEIVNLREIFCLLAKKAGYSLTDTGTFLDNRDHTTVIHNLKECQNHLDTEPEFVELYNQIRQEVFQEYESRLYRAKAV